MTITIQDLRKQHPEHTLQRIADMVGLSRERVRQVLARDGLPTKARRRTYRVALDGPNLTWSTAHGLRRCDVGVLAELLVCADLTRRGYDVYRAVNHGAATDLMIYVNGRGLRVEVKAAQIRPGGQWIAAYSGLRQPHDVLALVAPTGEIRYSPALPSQAKPA